MVPPEGDGDDTAKWRPPPSIDELFIPPSDPQVAIWRYMDFAKLCLDAAEQRTLFLA
jgi:hypothetical protein